MEIKYVLDEDDIKSIIASHFDVSKSDIVLSVKEEYVGYGTAEGTKIIFKAEVSHSKKGGF